MCVCVQNANTSTHTIKIDSNRILFALYSNTIDSYQQCVTLLQNVVNYSLFDSVRVSSGALHITQSLLFVKKNREEEKNER